MGLNIQSTNFSNLQTLITNYEGVDSYIVKRQHFSVQHL